MISFTHIMKCYIFPIKSIFTVNHTDYQFKIWKVKVTQSHHDSSTPWTVVHQAPLSMEFSRPEYTGVGSQFLLQGIFPTQGLNPGLLHCRRIIPHPISYIADKQFMYFQLRVFFHWRIITVLCLFLLYINMKHRHPYIPFLSRLPLISNPRCPSLMNHFASPECPQHRNTTFTRAHLSSCTNLCFFASCLLYCTASFTKGTDNVWDISLFHGLTLRLAH